MRADTEAWLAPLLREAFKRELDWEPLFLQASMPAAECPGAEPMFPDDYYDGHDTTRDMAVDYIRFGGLLADALGWDEYPAKPPE